MQGYFDVVSFRIQIQVLTQKTGLREVKGGRLISKCNAYTYSRDRKFSSYCIVEMFSNNRKFLKFLLNGRRLSKCDQLIFYEFKPFGPESRVYINLKSDITCVLCGPRVH